MKPRKAKGRPQPHNDRGEWRPFYEVLWDDPDFQKLDPESRWVWATLKGRAGACGIRLIPALEHVLARWTGYPLETVSKALRNLVHTEKIVLEGDVAWVRRGIDFEPTLFVNNALHRQFVANTLNALPRMEIVARYAEENAHWLEGTTYTLSKPFLNPTPTPTPTPTPSRGTENSGGDNVPPDLTNPDHRNAYQGFLRGATNPTARAASIAAVATGMPGHGPGYGWPVVGQALQEMAAGSVRYTDNALLGFARRVRDRPPATRPRKVLTDDLGRDVLHEQQPDGTWRAIA